MHIILHIDVNSAFLSWTALKMLREGSEVDIRTIPAIVGGNQETRHGIVTAKSIPAKAYGIETAEPVASALRKCPNLLIVPGDHAYYREQSRMLMDYLSSICPEIQQVSIDECYMAYEPIKERFSTPEEAAYYIKDTVREKFEFTVNVGISNRKVLAKMASDMKKPDKVHTLYTHELPEKLWPMPIESLHMCGKSSAAYFRKMGINTIGDLANSDKTMVEGWLKSHGKLLWEYANGIDESEVDSEPFKAKGVGNSTTLPRDYTKREEAIPVIDELCESVAGRLQKKGFLAGQISVEIKYATFQSVSHQMTIEEPTDSARQLKKCAYILFDELWNEEPIRLLGVRTTKMTDRDEPVQMDLFSYQKEWEHEKKQKEKSEKMAKLEAALGKIRTKYGDNMIQSASRIVSAGNIESDETIECDRNRKHDKNSIEDEQ